MIYSPCRYWKVHPSMGYIPSGFCKTYTRTCQNPHPWMRVRVLTGTGAGCPGKPQGSPWHSLLESFLPNLQFMECQTSLPAAPISWDCILCHFDQFGRPCYVLHTCRNFGFGTLARPPLHCTKNSVGDCWRPENLGYTAWDPPKYSAPP